MKLVGVALMAAALLAAALPAAAQDGAFSAHSGGFTRQEAAGASPPFSAGDGGAVPMLNPLARLRPDDLPGLAGRPLFSPSRRPPEVVVENAVVDAEPEPSPPPRVGLVGIVAAAQGQAFAVVRDEAGGATRTLRKGDDVDGWTVSDVAADRVVLGNGEREETLLLFAPGDRPEGDGDDDAMMADRAGPNADDADDFATADGDELLEMLRRGE